MFYYLKKSALVSIKTKIWTQNEITFFLTGKIIIIVLKFTLKWFILGVSFKFLIHLNQMLEL